MNRQEVLEAVNRAVKTMSDEVKTKLALNYWDLEEMYSVLGEAIHTIYDADDDYVYYVPAAFPKARMNVYGVCECWYNDKWCGEDELPEV